jgi:mannose-6-phosphate isomerase-like protein (cupin superfamily)
LKVRRRKRGRNEMEVRVTQWGKPEPPGENELYERMVKEGLHPYAWSNSPGEKYTTHSHAYHKVIYVAHGSIIWVLPDTNEELETRVGDRFDIPQGVVHAARVGPEGVICLEAHRD